MVPWCSSNTGILGLEQNWGSRRFWHLSSTEPDERASLAQHKNGVCEKSLLKDISDFGPA